MNRFRGLTWDHPRGYQALRDATALWPDLVAWQTQPLSGFESTPLDTLVDEYDLLLIDHPHVGDAQSGGLLQPLDAWLPAATLDDLASDAVGASFTSYLYEGHLWALPVDATCQVAAVGPSSSGDGLARSWRAKAPSWQDLADPRSRPPGRYTLSLEGPHAFLALGALCHGAGQPLLDSDGRPAPVAEVAECLGMMAAVLAGADRERALQNPIELLDDLADGALDYIPLTFGYVNYASHDGLTFCDAPEWKSTGRHGSTLGGVGIAVSRRVSDPTALGAYLTWLTGREAQSGFLPRHQGQPARRSAWMDEAANSSSHDFYRATLRTCETAWVRPRWAGFGESQLELSDLVRSCLLGGGDATRVASAVTSCLAQGGLQAQRAAER